PLVVSVGLQLKNPGLVIFRNGGYVNGQIKTQIKPDCFALGALLVKPHINLAAMGRFNQLIPPAPLLS
ncbi:MAG: hypothetical protein D4R39_01085, partial [Methylophilaceae bacterium]